MVLLEGFGALLVGTEEGMGFGREEEWMVRRESTYVG